MWIGAEVSGGVVTGLDGTDLTSLNLGIPTSSDGNAILTNTNSIFSYTVAPQVPSFTYPYLCEYP